MTVWAVGKLAGMRAGDEGGALAGLVARLLPSALARPGDFDPQGLANIISGVAQVGLPEGSSAVGKLMGSLRGRLMAFCAQEVANSLHGLAKLGARLDQSPGLAAEAATAIRAKLLAGAGINLRLQGEMHLVMRHYMQLVHIATNAISVPAGGRRCGGGYGGPLLKRTPQSVQGTWHTIKSMTAEQKYGHL